MDASTGTPPNGDECDGNCKSNNITVYENTTVVKRKGPTLLIVNSSPGANAVRRIVYVPEQRKALEMLSTVVEERCTAPIARRER